jgi:hypothetical protein
VSTKTSARFCTRCNARIIWAVTEGGNVALNFLTNQAGGFLAYQMNTGVWIGRVRTEGPSHHLLEKPYQGHAVTCTGPAELPEEENA